LQVLSGLDRIRLGHPGDSLLCKLRAARFKNVQGP
jgi:hypothetical protein